MHRGRHPGAAAGARPDGTRRMRRGWREIVIDVAPAAGLWIAGLLDGPLGLSDPVGPSQSVSAVVPITLVCALLLLRRRRPLAVVCGIAVVIAVPIWFVPLQLGYWGEFIPWLVALYSCARHEDHALRRVAGVALSAATLAVVALRYPEMADPGDLLYDGALLAGAWVLGLFARSWAGYRDDALRQHVERAAAEERAAAGERTRIARELHDIISHTIAVIVMQAGGARVSTARDPDAAADALARIETLGQESLHELRTLLAVLGDGSGAGAATESTPQPQLADVAALCERMRTLGLPVRLELDPAADVLSPGAQLAVYRVVQEALTNVLTHAGRVDTDVTVRRVADGAVEVRVASSAGDGDVSAPGGGRGLIGMRERVTALGGTFEATATGGGVGGGPGGGFVILARLPQEARVA